MANTAVLANQAATPSIDRMIADLADTRRSIADLNTELKLLTERKEQLELSLAAAMDALGTDQVRSKEATITLGERVLYSMENPESFYRFIRKNNAFHLLERRPAQAACRELQESRGKRPIPGLQSYTKRTVSFRTR